MVKQVISRAPQPRAKARRVLFLGNSITIHGPSAKVSWPNNWGMAASAREDYVHVLAKNAVAKLWGTPPQVRVEGLAEFERHYDTYDLDAGLKSPLDFEPDIVVVAIGQNVPALASEDAKTKFKDRFTKLLTTLEKQWQPRHFRTRQFLGQQDEG